MYISTAPGRSHTGQYAPVQAYSATWQSHSAPVPSDTAHVQSRTAPVQSRTAPVQSRTAPVQSRTAPVQSRTAPVQSYTAPVQFCWHSCTARVLGRRLYDVYFDSLWLDKCLQKAQTSGLRQNHLVGPPLHLHQ